MPAHLESWSWLAYGDLWCHTSPPQFLISQSICTVKIKRPRGKKQIGWQSSNNTHNFDIHPHFIYAEPVIKAKYEPSSTLPGHRSRLSWGRNSSVWRWDRLHQGGDIHGICHSNPGSLSTEPRPPGASAFSGSVATARRSWCWHTSQAYLPETNG